MALGLCTFVDSTGALRNPERGLRHVLPRAGAGLPAVRTLPALPDRRHRDERPQALRPSSCNQSSCSPPPGLNHGRIYHAGRPYSGVRRQVRLPTSPSRTTSRPSAGAPLSRRPARLDAGGDLRGRVSPWSSPPPFSPNAPASPSEAMRHGKDVMTDKPASPRWNSSRLHGRYRPRPADLSIYYEERLENPADAAGPTKIVRAGAIGDFVHLLGLGPHLLRKPTRLPFSSNANAMAASSPIWARTSATSSSGSPTPRRRDRARHARQSRQSRNARAAGYRRGDAAQRYRQRLFPRRLVHPARHAGIRRLPAADRRHRGRASRRASMSTSARPRFSLPCCSATPRASKPSTSPMPIRNTATSSSPISSIAPKQR